MNNNMNTTRMSRILKDLYYLHFLQTQLTPKHYEASSVLLIRLK